MKVGNQDLSWLTPRRATVGLFAVALLVTYFWPRSTFATDLVWITALPGAIGAVLSALTFWQPARVQIGRNKLKYKSVRHIGGAIGLACLPFLVVRQFSILISNPIGRHEAMNATRMRTRPVRFYVAIAKIKGDDGNEMAGHLVECLSHLDHRLMVSAVVLNGEIPVNGAATGASHLEAIGLTDDLNADVLFWGAAKETSAVLGPMYETRGGSEPSFGSAYLPPDFRLPEMSIEDFCEVLRLVVAKQSAVRMADWGYHFDDALSPLIEKVRSLRGDPKKNSEWPTETRARVDFILGVALGTSGNQLRSIGDLDSASSYLRSALSEWSRENNPLEWAMTQANLGHVLAMRGELTSDEATLEAALAAENEALGVYREKSDALDSTTMRFQSAQVLELIAASSGSSARMREAIENYREALRGYEGPGYRRAWAYVQFRIGHAIGGIADGSGDRAMFEQAIAADRAALSVYDQERGSISWVKVRGNLIFLLADLGELTSNREYLSESITMARDTLATFPRERDPAVWASVESNLGFGFMRLGDLNSDTSLLQQAGHAFQSALAELSPEREPMEWASAKDGLAATYLGLGKKTSDTNYFQLAAENYRDLLKVYPRNQDRVAWAWTKYNLGIALFELGSRETGTRHLEESVECFRETLSVLSKEQNAKQWNDIQDNLNTALAALRDRGWRGS